MKNNGICPVKNERRVPEKEQSRQRKIIALFVSVILILVIAAGGTVAFITTQTDRKTNTFTPAQVSSEVTENFDGAVKNEVAVKNTGNTDAYIRAAVNITWMKDGDAADQTVTAKVPKQGTDYAITYLENTGWIKGSDGYWYYQSPVAPGASTGTLIESCTQLAGADVPAGYKLSVEIAASAIQSSPETVVSAEWNVSIAGGKIVSVNGSGVTGE